MLYTTLHLKWQINAQNLEFWKGENPLGLGGLVFAKFLLVCIPALISVAFVTLLERKILSLVGLRVGPNKVSFVGFLQPLGDAAKLANKQCNLLSNFNYLFYYLSRVVLFLGSLMLWVRVS